MESELKTLSGDELLALVALIEEAVAADGYATDEETKQVRTIIAAVGKKAYQHAAEQADERFRDEEDLWTFLESITRQEARELIYEAVLETVLADAPRNQETALLERLSKLWKIKPRIIDPPE